MTSRETTGLLRRKGEDEVAGSDRRSLGDWVAVLGYGAIQWPWLLKSLYGGTLKAKHALLDIRLKPVEQIVERGEG